MIAVDTDVAIRLLVDERDKPAQVCDSRIKSYRDLDDEDFRFPCLNMAFAYRLKKTRLVEYVRGLRTRRIRQLPHAPT